ncbi:Gfo/Idh/MocA family protein [Halocatena halophila]|uniref:Gfo/Idh/MocA family protein n=1 Tax=Halocatena halophila TaxID=2814576 RepID=UPI002ED0C883
MSVTVAFVGTGPDPHNPEWGTSAAMAYQHAQAYDANESCSLVACADLVADHALAFANRFEIPDSNVYESYDSMVQDIEPDVVSVCTPVPTHAEIVLDLLDSGAVGAIHCEKPMADTWRNCQRMVDRASAEDVQLTFNHQRRFAETTARAQALIDDGAIGELVRFEVGGKNLFDFGSHLIDLCTHFHDSGEASWALCQIDYHTENVRYGTHNENQAIAHWRYDNGVDAVLATGEMTPLENHLLRLVGTAGWIDLWPQDDTDVSLRINRAGESETISTNDETMLQNAIDHVIECHETRATPIIGGEEVKHATEIVFGCWESARQRGRIDFPLSTIDNPLAAMVESGTITPASDG